MIEIPVPASTIIPDELIAAAARAWRAARDAGENVQPRVHAVLASHGYDMLAPVLDSLMRLGESCFGRQLCRNCPYGCKDGDTKMLCALLSDTARLDATDATRRSMFSGALTSARVMLEMA